MSQYTLYNVCTCTMYINNNNPQYMHGVYMCCFVCRNVYVMHVRTMPDLIRLCMITNYLYTCDTKVYNVHCTVYNACACD